MSESKKCCGLPMQFLCGCEDNKKLRDALDAAVRQNAEMREALNPALSVIQAWRENHRDAGWSEIAEAKVLKALRIPTLPALDVYQKERAVIKIAQRASKEGWYHHHHDEMIVALNLLAKAQEQSNGR